MRDEGGWPGEEKGEEPLAPWEEAVARQQDFGSMGQSPWLQAGSSLSKPHLGMSGGGYPKGQYNLRSDTAISSWEVPL